MCAGYYAKEHVLVPNTWWSFQAHVYLEAEIELLIQNKVAALQERVNNSD